MHPALPPIAEVLLAVACAPVIHGDPLLVDFSVIHLRADLAAQLTLSLFDPQSALIYETLLVRLGLVLPPPIFGAAQHGRLKLPAPLAPGKYRLRLALLSNSPEEESVGAEISFVVPAPQPGGRFSGRVNLGATLAGGAPDEAVLRDCEMRQRRWSASAPARLNLDGAKVAGLVSGFYPFEKYPEGGFRWTGPRAVFQLRTAGPELSAHVIAARPDIHQRSVEVALCAGGREIGRLPLANSHGELRFPLPETLRGQVTVFTLTISNPWRPADLVAGNEDRRLLGLALSRLESMT